jgi:hypothetical protein
MNQRSIADFGRRIAVDTHPFHYASYVLPVRQYRILQARFLQCLGYPKPPCDLLHFGSLHRVVGTCTH